MSLTLGKSNMMSSIKCLLMVKNEHSSHLPNKLPGFHMIPFYFCSNHICF